MCSIVYCSRYTSNYSYTHGYGFTEYLSITRYFVYLLPTVLETIPTLPRAAARLAHASRPHRTDIAAGLLGRAPHRFVSFGQLTPPRRSVAFRTRCT